MGFKQFGLNIELGTGVKAAEEVFRAHLGI